MALSPVSIMVSGFHGNTDPVMICLVLLSIYLVESGRPAWLCGAIFGMAMWIKIVPVIFLPAFGAVPENAAAAHHVPACSRATFVSGLMPTPLRIPRLILHNVLVIIVCSRTGGSPG